VPKRKKGEEVKGQCQIGCVYGSLASCRLFFCGCDHCDSSQLKPVLHAMSIERACCWERSNCGGLVVYMATVVGSYEQISDICE